MNYQNNFKKKDTNLMDYSNQHLKHLESFHPSQSIKIQPQRIQNSDSEQKEGCFEDSDNVDFQSFCNPMEDNPPTDQDISFEENNTNFLKTQKYRKQPPQKNNNRVDSSQEIESDDQYYKNNDQSNSSHIMSNFIQQLKEDKKQVGYKNKFEKKKTINHLLDSRDESKGMQRVNDNMNEFREEKTFQKFKENSGQQRYYKGQKFNQTKGMQSHQLQNLDINQKDQAKENGKNKINNNYHREHQEQLHYTQINNKNKNNFYQQQFTNNNKKQFNGFQECEEKSDEYKSSSVPSSERLLDRKSSQKGIRSDIQMSQPLSDICQANSQVDEEQYFTLENKGQMLESIQITNTESGDQKQILTNHNRNSLNNKQNCFNNNQISSKDQLPISHLDKISKMADSYNGKSPQQQNKNTSILLTSNQSNNKTINSQDQQDQTDTQTQSYFLSSYNGHTNNNKSKSANKQIERNNSQILITNNSKTSSSFTVFGFQDEFSHNYSPLHQLNMYKHSDKSNQKNNSLDRISLNSLNLENKYIKDIQPIVNQPSGRLPLSMSQIKENLKPQQTTQQQQLSPKSSNNNFNFFQKEIFEKNQCKQVQSYEMIQEKENRFYQERKKSLEKKYHEIQKINNENEKTNKEEFIQIIAERLILELRMANKVISFLECQNKFFLNKLEGINQDQQNQQHTLSNFICKTCQSTSQYEKDDNITFSRITKSQYQASNFTQSQSQAEKIVENQNVFNSSINGSNHSLNKQNSFNNLQSCYNNSQESSLHDDFKNLVKDFQNLKQMSLKQQEQIEQLEKQNLSLLKQTIFLQDEVKEKEILLLKSKQEYEQDKENLIEEINKLTKENLEVRDQFSCEIKQIKTHEAKEFHDLEAKVRQTIQKKDDCIQKLNQIIFELKSQ